MLHYSYFRENYKMVAIDLSKQKALDANHAIPEINFNANLDRAANTRNYFIFEEAVKTGLLDFTQGTVKVF